jgi:hypothetical protein
MQTRRRYWTYCAVTGLLTIVLPLVKVEAEQLSGAAPILELSIRTGRSWKIVPLKGAFIETPLSVNCDCNSGRALLSVVAAADLDDASATIEITGAEPTPSTPGNCPRLIPVSANFGPLHLSGSLEADIKGSEIEYNGTLTEDGPSPSTKLSISRLIGTPSELCPLEPDIGSQLSDVGESDSFQSNVSKRPSLSAASAPAASTSSFELFGKTRFLKLAPKLWNPIKVLISRDGGSFPDKDSLLPKVGPEDSDHGYTLTSVETKTPINIPPGKVYYFPFDRDVEVLIKTPITITKQIAIYGGRNVVVRGIGDGYITKKLDPKNKIPALCDYALPECRKKLFDYRPDVGAVLRIDSPRRSAVVGDFKVRVSGDFTDAIIFRQNPKAYSLKPPIEYDKFGGIDIFVYNIGAYEIGGAGPGQHGDIVQLQSGIYRNMFFENIEGSTGYQGFFLPHRPSGAPGLCSVETQKKPGSSNEDWKVRKCLSPIVIKEKGKAFLENVVLRAIDPKLCPHCLVIPPYRGLYSKDPDVTVATKTQPKYIAPSYETFLQNVTFFTDPIPHERNQVPLYVMPQPPDGTPEGTINMTIATNGVTKGRLNVLSTVYQQAKEALINSGWQTSIDKGAKSPYPEAPEVSCGKRKDAYCSATFVFGPKRLVLLVRKGDNSALMVVRAHY